MSVAENDAIGRRFFAEQDRLGGEPAPDLCAQTYTAQINDFPPMDRAGHHTMAIGFYGAFPDMHQIIEATIADEKGVALRFRARGTHRGDFMGIPATGKPINDVGTAIDWIETGRVTRLQELFDLQTLMQQISTTPS